MWFHKALLFLLVFLISSCSTGVDSQDININNNHTGTIMVDLWDLESSNTVDPAPAFPIDESNISAIPIEPTESYTFSNSEIKGNSNAKKLRLFLYEVRGDSAFYQSSFSLFSSQEINISHGADGFFID